MNTLQLTKTTFQLIRMQIGFTLSQATKALRESRGIALLYFRPLHQKGVRVQRHAPTALYPRGKTRYPLYRRLGGPQGRSGLVRKISPHRDFFFVVKRIFIDPRSPDRPARRQSLYRLRYPAHINKNVSQSIQNIIDVNNFKYIDVSRLSISSRWESEHSCELLLCRPDSEIRYSVRFRVET